MTMRFLADESCDFAVVRSLRTAEDSEVIELALREERILLTEDKDFGRLVYSHGQETLGVIFLRFPTFARKQISRDVLNLVKQQGEKLAGSFVTVQPGRIRISHAPGD
jgi:predicted nuclease of predicted toxin-antitoxin system